jgi:hypothetical protein
MFKAAQDAQRVDYTTTDEAVRKAAGCYPHPLTFIHGYPTRYYLLKALDHLGFAV